MKIYDVFISYRRREADGREQGSLIANALYNYLISKDIQVFLDTERMENGPFPEQLQWQVTHAPNYIFIATEAAMHFRDVTPPDEDYVAEELKLALKLYPENPGDRTILPIIPHDVSIPADSDASYPEEVHRLFKHNAPKQLTGELPSEENLKEILKKVTCVNRGNLWNAGYRWYENSRMEGHRFASLNIDRTIMPQAGLGDRDDVRFPIRAGLEDQEDKPLMDQIRDTKGHLYLIGEGGAGKTTALFSIMEDVYGAGKSEDDIERYRLNGQVPLFIELSRAPDTYGRLYEGGVSTFIKRAVYMQMRTDLKAKQISAAAVEQVQDVFDLDPETAVRPITDLFNQTTRAPEYLLLLDGLNEVSRTEIGYKYIDGDGTEKTGRSAVVSMVLGEIRDLMKNSPNVRIILTSRSKEESNWNDRATLLYLSGIKPEAIESYLREHKVSEARIDAALHNSALQEILRVPLFLTMYASLKGEDELLSRGEIMKLFFHQKKEKLYTAKDRIVTVGTDVAGAASAKQPDRLTADLQSYILDFILPEIAWRMAKVEEIYIQRDFLGKDGEGLDEIIEFVLTDDSPTTVNGKYGSQVFKEYRSTSDMGMDTAETANQLIERFGSRMTKVCPGILNCAVMTLGILQSDGVIYAFIHQHVRDYFAAVYQINRLKMAVYLQEHNRNGLALTCLEDWKNEPLPLFVQQFIGEALGEKHNKPWCYDVGNWHYNVPDARSEDPATQCDRNLLARALNIYRERFDGEDGYGLWNLMQILKEVRYDLSGEDFSRLDMTGFRLNGYCLGQKGCAADFHGSKAERELFRPGGHTAEVTSAAFSPDGRWIVTASEDGTAKVWDAETFQEIGTLEGHMAWVTSAAYSPDGRRIVTASADQNAKIWDAETFRELGALEGHTDEVTSAAYSPDGRRIVTASDDFTSKIWDAETLCELGTLEGHTDRVTSAAYSPDGRHIVTASDDKTAKIWDAETCLELGTLEGHSSVVNSTAYSPDGRHIVTASDDKTAKIWDAETRLELGTLEEHFLPVTSASYSPDGMWIVTASWDNTGKIWDAKTFRELGTLKGHSSFVNSTVYSPDGRRIVTASEDMTAKVWDAETFRELGTLKGHEVDVTFAVYSPDGRRIVSASRDKTAKIWDAESFRELGALEGHTHYVTSASYSPEGRRIVTSSWDETAKIWDAETFRELGALEGHTHCVTSASYSPDGRRIVTSSWDNTAKVWDAETFRELGMLEGHTNWVTSAAYSLDGRRIVTVSEDKAAKVWDSESYRKIGTLEGFISWVITVAFSPDGMRIVTASHRTAIVWEAGTFRELGTLEGHTQPVTSAAYSPDGKRIVTASSDGTVKIWDASTFECLHTIRNIPGLEVLGCDFRNLHPTSTLTDDDKQLLWEYGARFNDDDTPPMKS